VLPFDQVKLYGKVPPVHVKVILPASPPLQVMLVLDETMSLIMPGWVIVTVAVLLTEQLSVTVTVYEPALSVLGV
jgi:hypothetical protein